MSVKYMHTTAEGTCSVFVFFVNGSLPCQGRSFDSCVGEFVGGIYFVSLANFNWQDHRFLLRDTCALAWQKPSREDRLMLLLENFCGVLKLHACANSIILSSFICEATILFVRDNLHFIFGGHQLVYIYLNLLEGNFRTGVYVLFSLTRGLWASINFKHMLVVKNKGRPEMHVECCEFLHIQWRKNDNERRKKGKKMNSNLWI
ncbi:hypothetical protein QL285_000197 [Trifolium repens]|nr:hypothetical protein QL285_000197 [Trifolium repens]